jgi:hypothetical protein
VADATLWTVDMERVETVTARGTGTWGGRQYGVELVASRTVWTDSLGLRSAEAVTYKLVCSDPVGPRFFEDERAREDFVQKSFSEIAVELVDPEVRVPPEPLDAVVGEELASITFVRDYVQMSFDSPPLTLWVWPRLHRLGEVLERHHPAYTDALLGLIGKQLVATDEFLDLGLTLDFDDGTRLSVPLDGTDANGPEAAMFNGEPGGLWPAGGPPFS